MRLVCVHTLTVFFVFDRIRRTAFGDRLRLVATFLGDISIFAGFDRCGERIRGPGRGALGLLGEFACFLLSGLVEFARPLAADLVIFACAFLNLGRRFLTLLDALTRRIGDILSQLYT